MDWISIKIITGGSEERTFKTRFESPELLLPANNAIDIYPDSVLLVWTNVDGATEYRYQYTTDVTFSSYIESVVSDTSLLLLNLDQNAEYFWLKHLHVE